MCYFPAKVNLKKYTQILKRIDKLAQNIAGGQLKEEKEKRRQVRRKKKNGRVEEKERADGEVSRGGENVKEAELG